MSVSGRTPLQAALEESEFFAELLQLPDAHRYRQALEQARCWQLVPGEVLSDPETLRGAYIVLTGLVHPADQAPPGADVPPTRIYGQWSGLRGQPFSEKLVARQRSAVLECKPQLLALLCGVPNRFSVDFYSPLVAGLGPIADLPVESLEKVLRESSCRLYRDGEAIVREGEYGGTMFFVLEGEAEIHIAGGPHPVARRGDFFGEIAVLAYQTRSATITARGDCLVLECDRSAVAELRKKSKIFKTLVEERYRQNAMIGQLRKTSFFGGLEVAELESIRDIGTLESFEPYEPIFFQGQEADALYVVLNGTMLVVEETARGPRPIAWVRTGETVGEMALLPEPGETGRRGQTVAALQRVDAIRIPAADFQDIVARHADVRKKLVSMTRQRRVMNEQLEDDAQRAVRLGWMMETQHIAGNWVLGVRMDDCIRCNNCVTACQEVHPDGLNRFLWDNMRQDEDVLPQVRLSHSCQHCEFALCAEVCPTHALQREAGSGAVFIEYDRCIRCGKCADPSQGCPYGSIQIVPADQVRQQEPLSLVQQVLRMFRKAGGEGSTGSESKSGKNYPVKCDLCHGRPQQACVQSCPTGAVIRIDGDRQFAEALAKPAPVETHANRPSDEQWELIVETNWAHPPVAGKPAELDVRVGPSGEGLKIYCRRPEHGVSVLKLNFFMIASDTIRIGGGGPMRQLQLPVHAAEILEGQTRYALTCRTPGPQVLSLAVYQGGLYLGHTTIEVEFGKPEKPEKPAVPARPATPNPVGAEVSTQAVKPANGAPEG